MTGLFDLHCDTLTCRGGTDNALDDAACQLALGKVPAGTRWVQCFAVFVPDSLRGGEAAAFFDRYAALFRRQAEAHRDRFAACRSFAGLEAALSGGKTAGVLTVEGGAALAGRPERVKTLRDAGVRMLTLTWNGPNEIGSGHDTAGGLTAFGKEAVAELERCGIIVDASHLNDRGLEDLLATAKKPFAASHSNARAVCAHRRNLPDPFIREIAARGGLIGLNYSRDFLSGRGGGSLDDLYRHVCHFLELDAGACLALGSDYDGTDIHTDLDSVEKSLRIYGYLTGRGIPADTAEGIMFANAWRFFQAWLS